MFEPRGDWKSVAADRLRRMGREDSAKDLYRIDKPKHQIDKRQAREWRKEAKSQEQLTPHVFPCPAEKTAAPLTLALYIPG